MSMPTPAPAPSSRRLPMRTLLTTLAITVGGGVIVAAVAQAVNAPNLLGLRPAVTQSVALGPSGQTPAQVLAQAPTVQYVSAPGNVRIVRPSVTPAFTATAAAPGVTRVTCIAFSKDGRCVAHTQPQQTVTTFVRPLAHAVAPRQVIQTLVPANLGARDYTQAYFGLGRFEWGGMDYGGRSTAYSLAGYSLGFETGRGRLFAMGRWGHYSEDKSFNLAPGAVDVFDLTGVRVPLGAIDQMQTDNLHTIFEGAIGTRLGLAPGFDANVALYGRRDTGDYQVTFTNTVGDTLTLNEEITSTYLGARLGGTVARPITQQLSVRASGGIAPVFVTHKYRGVETTNLVPGEFVSIAQLDDEFGFVADGRVAVEFKTTDNFAFTLGGFGNFVSSGLEIDRPDAADNRPVTLRTAPTYDAGVMAGVTVEF